MPTIAAVAWEVADGKRRAPNTASGACLSNARQIADQALGFGVYARYGSGWDARYRGPTAATAEATWAAAGLAVRGALAPGDFLFTGGDSPAGHVGIYLGTRGGVGYVLENTYANRGEVVAGQQYVRLTPLSIFGTPRTVIRFPGQDAPEGPPAPQDGPAAPPPGPAPTPTVPGGILGALGVPLADLLNIPRPPLEPVQRGPLGADAVLNTLPAFRDRAPASLLTNLGEVSSLVILRAPYADEVEYAAPVIGPFLVSGQAWLSDLRRAWGNLKTAYFGAESWGRYYAPVMEFSLDPARHRLPLPDVTRVYVSQSTGGMAWAEVELHVPDAEAAEMYLATLTHAALQRNVLCEVWLPVTHATQDGPAAIVEPLFVGMIGDITTSPHPHGIRFRVEPQDAVLNAVGMDPDQVRTNWTGATIAQIIEDIAQDHRLLIVTPSAPRLEDIPALQRVMPAYNALYRPPLDVIRELVERAGGLTFQRLGGTELAGYALPGLPRGVWAVIDPAAYHPFTAGFWRNTLWSRVLAPIANVITPGGDAVGEVAVLYPADIVTNPKAIKTLAATLETFGTPEARRNPVLRFVEAAQAALSLGGIGGGPAIKAALDFGAADPLNALLDSWWAAAGSDAGSRVSKLLCPVLNVTEFTARLPGAGDLNAPIYGTPAGQDAQGSRVRGRVVFQPQRDGSLLPTGAFTRDEVGAIAFGRATARPALNAAPPVEGGPQEQVSAFYPYRVALEVMPQAGLRVGMLAALIGMRRLDGMYQVEAVEHDLDGRSQTVRVTLRTQRPLFVA